MSQNKQKLPQVSLVFNHGYYYLRTNGTKDTAISLEAFRQYIAQHPEYRLGKRVFTSNDGSHRIRIRLVPEKEEQ